MLMKCNNCGSHRAMIKYNKKRMFKYCALAVVLGTPLLISIIGIPVAVWLIVALPNKALKGDKKAQYLVKYCPTCGYNEHIHNPAYEG